MTKLEEIARAIGDARCDAGRPDPGKGLDEFIARAVLSTLKTPTTAMKMAGAIAITAGHMKAMANYDAACDAYSAMIDAADDGGRG